jgi:adenosylcobyric acid synthase
VVGLCGGYQLLGERITNAGVESTDDIDALSGFGLLPVETRFESAKRVEPVTRELSGVGPLTGAAGSVRGYEIHMGKSRLTGDARRPFPGDECREPDGAATERVLGTYLHGLFENRVAREAFVESVFAAADCDRPSGNGNQDGTNGAARGGIDAAADRAAALLGESVDLSQFHP